MRDLYKIPGLVDRSVPLWGHRKTSLGTGDTANLFLGSVSCQFWGIDLLEI
jgi:hypothetical protein